MFSRALPRTATAAVRNSSATLSTPAAAQRLIHSYRPSTSSVACLRIHPQSQQVRAASTEHAISNPTLAGIEKRWEGMPPQEQAELWMQLRDRMKVDWHEMTLQEKKAGM